MLTALGHKEWVGFLLVDVYVPTLLTHVPCLVHTNHNSVWLERFGVAALQRVEWIGNKIIPWKRQCCVCLKAVLGTLSKDLRPYRHVKLMLVRTGNKSIEICNLVVVVKLCYNTLNSVEIDELVTGAMKVPMQMTFVGIATG